MGKNAKRLKRRQQRAERKQQNRSTGMIHTDYRRETTFVTAEKLGYTIPFTSDMTPAQMFLRLTATTCPHGFEHALYGPSLEAMGFSLDGHGNYIAVIGADVTRTMFTAHLDTIAGKNPEVVVHAISFDENGNPVRVETDKTSNLGADDKAGVVCLMALYNAGVPGYYYLFHGEESGAQGSRDADAGEDWGTKVDRCVSFDRRGYKSIITCQSGHRTASDAFANALASDINQYGFQYGPDPTGSFTDSDSFSSNIPECTNLSVGYDGAHGKNETQNLAFLTELCSAIVKVDWESLPTVRDPKSYETKTWGAAGTGWSSRGTYGKGYDYYDDEYLWYERRAGATEYTSITEDDDLPGAKNASGQYNVGGEWFDYVPSKRGSSRKNQRVTQSKSGSSLLPSERLQMIFAAGVVRFTELLSWVQAHPQAATQTILMAWEENPNLFDGNAMKIIDISYTDEEDEAAGYNADNQFS